MEREEEEEEEEGWGGAVLLSGKSHFKLFKCSHVQNSLMHLLWEHFPNEPKVKKTQSYSCASVPH